MHRLSKPTTEGPQGLGFSAGPIYLFFQAEDGIRYGTVTGVQTCALPILGGQTRMPMIQAEVEKFFNKKPHMGVNPDEVVALGAAVHAGVLQGDVKDVLLLD